MRLIEIVYSVAGNKCPRCHIGKMFESNNPYKIGKGLSMLNTCPHCQLNYNPEPWYYFGAMYVSYALTVGLGVLWWLGFSMYGDYSFLIFFATLALVILLLSPITFRWSRTLWINFFFKYKKEYR